MTVSITNKERQMTTSNETLVNDFASLYYKLKARGLITGSYISFTQKAINQALIKARHFDTLRDFMRPVIGVIYTDAEYPLHLQVPHGSAILDDADHYTVEQLIEIYRGWNQDAEGNLPPDWQDPTGFKWVKDGNFNATWVEPVWEEQTLKGRTK